MAKVKVKRLLKEAIEHLDGAKDCLRRARDESEACKMEMVTAWGQADNAVDTILAIMRLVAGTERGQS